jgi:sialate O-acetylesterase
MINYQRWQEGLFILSLALSSCKTSETFSESDSNAKNAGKNPQLHLPEIFSNNMVLQRDKEIIIWGKAPSGADVCIKIFATGSDQPIRSKCYPAGIDNQFRINLAPVKGSPTAHTMVVETLGEKKVLEDVLIGDVWLTAGQSNMQLKVKHALEKDEANRSLPQPHIRLFVQEMITSDMRSNTSKVPLFNSPGASWRKAISPKDIEDSSATGFFFAGKISEHLAAIGENIPVGIINTAVGASDIYAWMSPQKMNANEKLRNKIPKNWRSEGGPLYQESYLQPTACFNHKIGPIAPFGIRGFLWTQGEGRLGDEGEAANYRHALRELIHDWREHWQSPDLPFILTQAHPTAFPYSAPRKLDELAFTREAQIDIIRDAPFTCTVAIHDVDLTWNSGDFEHKHPIHPLAKKLVGERMANAAWQLSYLRKSDCHAPIFNRLEIRGSRGKVFFSYVGDGLSYRMSDHSIRGFAISGEDRMFYPAEAEITGKDSVEVWHPKVTRPVAITYAFTQMNQGSNLVRSDGTPVSPFRSDRLKSTYLRIKPTIRQEAEMVKILQMDPPARDRLIQDPKSSRQAYREFQSHDLGQHITFEIITVDEGSYTFSMQALKGPNFGQARIFLDDEVLKSNVDFFAPVSGMHSLKLADNILLKPGSHALKMELVGKNPSSSDVRLGIDMFELIQHGPSHSSIVEDW